MINPACAGLAAVGEDRYFIDPNLFWTYQSQALAARRPALLADGWTAVEVLEAGRSFESWKHERVSKAKGGKVFLTAERAEVTSVQQSYIDLHRLAAVRAVLTDHAGVALRLLVAHAVAGSPLWRVEVDPRRAGNEAVSVSLEAAPAEATFRAKRAAAAALLGLEADGGLVGRQREGGAAAIFAKLLSLSEADVLAVAAVVMGETLAAGSAEVEAAGLHLKVDMAAFWSPDQAFFDLIRDREAVNAMLREVGGKKVADGNPAEKVTTQKAILRDFPEGAGDRPKVAKWTPKWLTFPALAYTRRPFATAQKSKAVAPLLRRARALGEPDAASGTALAADPNPAILAAQ